MTTRDYSIKEPGAKEDEQRIRKRNKASFILYLAVGLVLTLLALLIFVKTFWTASFDAGDWKALNAHMEMENAPTLPMRGNIYSDAGSPLAISVPRYKVRIDFRAGGFNDDFFLTRLDSLSSELSAYFKDRSAAGYRAHLMKGYEQKKRSWNLITRDITHTELKALQAMTYFKKGNSNVTGLTTERSIRRVNPYDNLALRTVGKLMTDADRFGITHGSSGLELEFDSVLCGKRGVDRFIYVPRTWVRDPVKLPQNGMDVYTTINVDIQDITESALRDELVRVNADWGCAVVMEVKTGAIKAISNLDRKGEGVYEEGTNHALADLLEPGSTFKSVSLLASLETGKIQPEDTFDTGNGVYHYAPGLIIRDHNANKGGYGKIPITKALTHSSNIGTWLGVNRVFGKESPSNNRAFFNAINRMSVFDPIKLEIPGTAKARINKHPEEWPIGSMPWISFGYQVQLPPIYTLRFYNAVANDGKMMEPYLVTKVADDKTVYYENGPKVINEKIAGNDALHKIQAMIRGVVTDGTGKPMNSPFVQIAGKTGTAQILGSGIYGANGHNVTFCGYFPSDDPIYSCIVVVSHPRGVYPSGAIPGAVLRAVAEQSVAASDEVRLSRLKPDSAATFDQRIGGGLLSAVRSSARFAGADLGEIPGDGDWVTYAARDSEQEMRLVDPASTRMPDLIGMTASDAVFLCELLGLETGITGKGGFVRSQNIPPERKISRGSRVLLSLH